MDTRALPEVLLELITTEQVRVKEVGEMIQLVPVKEAADCTIGLRGMFAGDPEMTVDKFLERKRADKELEQ
jgi:hypothetical protein